MSTINRSQAENFEILLLSFDGRSMGMLLFSSKSIALLFLDCTGFSKLLLKIWFFSYVFGEFHSQTLYLHFWNLNFFPSIPPMPLYFLQSSWPLLNCGLSVCISVPLCLCLSLTHKAINTTRWVHLILIVSICV